MASTPKYKKTDISGGLNVSGEIVTSNFAIESGSEDAQVLIDTVNAQVEEDSAVGIVSTPVYVMQVVENAPVFTASFSVTIMPQQPE